MGPLLQDVRFGMRVLRRTPVITGSIILLLALGIGVNSAMFGIVDALLLHAVRYPDPQSLVFVWSLDAQGAPKDASVADFMDWRARSKSLSGLAAWMPGSFVITGGDRPRQALGARVTANFFRTLGVKPALGRTFLPDEDGLDVSANASHNVIISYRLWQEDLGADPNVLGRIIRIDATPYAIIGVAPSDFQFWWRPHDLWIPVSLNVHDRDYHSLVVIARLAAPRASASAEMAVISQSLAQTYPKSDKGWTIRIDDFQEWLLNKTFRTRLLLLCGAVGLVLLLACANVASLLLARSAVREREIALRLSLGASRSRIVAQLLTESSILALIGGALGLAIAWSLIRLAPKFVPPNAIPGGPVELSVSVIWFTLAASLLTCALFGLAPAVASVSSDTQASLKDSSRGSTAGRKRSRFRQTMVAAEVAVALILLAGTWLMIGDLRDLTKIDPGFDPKNVLTLRLYLPAAKYDTKRALGFYRQAMQRIATLPGVKSVTMGSSLPLLLQFETRFSREGALPVAEGEWPNATYIAIGVDYFPTLSIPLRRGRMFTESDNENAPLMAIVNESLVTRYFSTEDPLGKRLVVDRPVATGFGEETVKLEIVGVVGNARLTDLSADSKPVIYVPHPQNPRSRAVWFAARTAGDPLTLGSAVRSEFMNLDPEQPVEQVGSLEQMVAGQFAQPRFQTGLMTSFALMALLLAAVGIYGVNTYAVEQRRNEIGVRMALGASRMRVLGDILLQGMRPTAIGIAAGIAGAEAVAYWMKSVLVGTATLDPLAFLGAALLLAIVAAAACYIPAHKATRIDPAIALRAE